MKKFLKWLLICSIWCLLWQLIASIINRPVIFASFLASLKTLFSLLQTTEFYLSIYNSLLSITIGIFTGYLVGFVLAYLANHYKWVKEFISPLLQVFKSVPVASFAVLVLIWFSSKTLSILICFIIVFPQIYFATLNGLANVNKEMLEVAKVFRMSKLNQFLYVYRLAIAPYVISASASAISMGFKSAIAGEVIGASINTIGQQLYFSKMYLDTATLFSYTFVIIVLSSIIEQLLMKLIRYLGGHYDNQAQ